MKKLMKMASFVFALVLMLNLAACGGSDKSDSPYVGTWTATTAEMSGISLPIDSVFEEFTVELKSNGTATVNVDGDSQSGKWEEIDGGVEIDGEIDMMIDGDAATMDYSGIVITFER